MPQCLSSHPEATLHLLVAPAGQLSGDGQLRELMQERRRHLGDDAGLWYLSSVLIAKLGRSAGHEALAIGDAGAAAWLQLRFGGNRETVSLSSTWLNEEASRLPESTLPVQLN